MKKIIIFGGSGFIGRHLLKELGEGYEIALFSRDPAKLTVKLPKSIQPHKIDFTRPKKIHPYFEQADGIINLAGESVGERWTNAKKLEIENSRIKIDRVIFNAFNDTKNNIKFVIQGSGMGVYGLSRNEFRIDETSKLGKHGFLTRIGLSHEKALSSLQDKTRLVFLRTGLVLDRDEGALPKIASAFKSGFGGPMGNGTQWNSWIHIKDEVRAIKFLIENENAKGAYNLTAPNPVKQKEFATVLGAVLNKPSFFKKPAFLLKMMMGEMADELLLKGLHVLPKHLLDEGFKFQFNTLEEALIDIYKK